jgi:hypothetical protein
MAHGEPATGTHSGQDGYAESDYARLGHMLPAP